ncbi:MAG: PLD nuclease N-terminal domain-containing protein [Rothia sp. (in: high G+C Gram-positive bacteria)]|nr:PLD nuclease N-terminal domain-containing protein [Rothia sp. (in: high G+C Gram-positive bacteria)]
MGRAILIIGGGALLLAVWIYAVLDAAQADSNRVRTLPKGLWILITLLFPLLGSVLWFWLGRPNKSSYGSFGPPMARPERAPDDDPEFLRFLEARAKRAQQDQQRAEGKTPEQGKDAAPRDDEQDGGTS